ncbi:MAG: S8 family serine peptidase [Thermoleophilia bacterium]|nr:S8 family serine peptidase [Thermoleophilia bacterium]MDH5280002.1 S8 family serine peptidase [Thermoleophilia bacterium]
MRLTTSRGSRALVGRTLLLGTFAVVSALAVGSAVSAQTQASPDRTAGRALPDSVIDQKLDSPISLEGVSASDIGASAVSQGAGKAIIRLSAESGAEAFAKGKSEAQAKKVAKAQQDAFLSRAKSIDPNARVLGGVQMVMNAVFVEVDASKLAEIARDPAVVRVALVGNYELDLSETVPYIGAKAVQDAGVTGKGIKVAVLDSGIDYTHSKLGGSGNPADYAANNPDIIEPGTFPTAKVKGGYDFIGSTWTGGPGSPAEAPDPDPLDDGPAAGHGTHVGHIIGGTGGVAPGVDLYAVKVCSSVTTSCSGISLIQGMEFTVDPNGDGNFRDRMHLINMSLGSSYGQPFDDDLSLAVENATKVGILTVASAGNSSDKPYANGTPASADSALSVAQTAVPSAFLPLMQIVAPASIAGQFPAVFQPWAAPLTTAIEAPLQYGNGAGANLDGCAAFPAGSLAGKIVLVNRGACNFTLKIKNVGDAGGLIGIIGLIAPGDPFEGGDGGDAPITIPGYMVSQAISNRLKSGLPSTVVKFDPNVGIPLEGSIVGSSSRGPQHESTTRIKPEIGAPGASVSAIAGTGTGEGPFGGTSGAAPMVTGSAALLLEGFGGVKTTAKGTASGKAIGLGLKPIEVKALLMNNAETNIISNPLTGALAEITRIGGGEVRVNQAFDAPVAAWDDGAPTGALGFGFVDVDGTVTLKKTVRIRNYENKARTYTITPTFRFAGDESNGAVSVSAPAKVDVKPGLGRDATFDITMTIDGSKLRGNFMNSGSTAGTGAALTTNEYDGYVVLNDGGDTVNIPWHVLPRKAAKVVPSTTDLIPGSFPQIIGLDNQGVGTAQNDAYALIATSPDIPEGSRGGQSPTPDLRAVGINTFPVPAGFCSANPSFLWAFAVNTWERQEHLLPVSHQVILDTNQDGTADYIVLNRDASGPTTITDGRQLTWVLNLSTSSLSAFFFAEHSMNTGNTVLYICGEQIGMNAANLLATNVDMSVFAQDFYYGGPGDEIDGLTVTPLGERFFGLPNDVPGKTNDAAGLSVYDYGLFPGNTPELGLMLVTNGDRGAGARGGATKDTEALLFRTP